MLPRVISWVLLELQTQGTGIQSVTLLILILELKGRFSQTILECISFLYLNPNLIVPTYFSSVVHSLQHLTGAQIISVLVAHFKCSGEVYEDLWDLKSLVSPYTNKECYIAKG